MCSFARALCHAEIAEALGKADSALVSYAFILVGSHRSACPPEPTVVDVGVPPVSGTAHLRWVQPSEPLAGSGATSLAQTGNLVGK